MDRIMRSLALIGAKCQEKNSASLGNSFVDILERLFQVRCFSFFDE